MVSSFFIKNTNNTEETEMKRSSERKSKKKGCLFKIFKP